VHFIGSVPPEELPGIYRLAAVHALPSWRETPGLASLEAAAAGCRIVTTGIGSARDYFGEDAWYCDPPDRASIRTAVVGALAAQPSSRLRRRVLADYTWDAAARATLEAYQAALKDNYRA
jgi:glycosyltransferase involved in cell wall biosynthesis